MALDPSLNEKIIDVGRQVFGDLGDTDPSLLDPRYLNSLLMRWSMGQPEFKVNLFRLVDVLPTLTSNQAIAEHVREYLIPPANKMHPSLGWFISLCEQPLLANVAAFMVKQGVKQMASTFIAGNSPTAALPVLRRLRGERYSFTVDLLGEFCVCEKEANEYLNRYLDAIETFGGTIPSWKEGRPIIEGHPGEISPVCISVKLSALYSQTNSLNFERSVSVLSERLAEIARRVRRYGALMYIDAEDSGNNSIIYEAFKRVFGSPEFIDLPYPGIVIQAYAKNSEARVDEMLAFARQRGSPIAIRLVKGAYWDFERVVSSQNDWEFPLWSKKESSDAHYEHLSRKLLDNHILCLPAFGSHNIRSLSHACCYAESIGLSESDFEVQVLYGMAEPIARAFMKRGHLVRMYVPLGELLPGMGYLVRRLLENTSNESFLRHTFFDEDEVSTLLREPHLQLEDGAPIPLTSPLSSIDETSLTPERANGLP
jgi:RHH-type transcriptional regulator, proline utilization regulon repressor / proline dehydrogenase / delta 1-pyrroline-5-carboxylate dehydrogenase